jgi:hypothetical protein
VGERGRESEGEGRERGREGEVTYSMTM